MSSAYSVKIYNPLHSTVAFEDVNGLDLSIPPYGTLNATVSAAVRETLLRGGLRLEASSAIGGSGNASITENRPPNINDDSGDGLIAGQVWVDQLTNKAYILVEDTLGGAVWQEVGAGSNNAVAMLTAPSNTDDSSSGYAVGQVWVDTVANKIYVLTDDSLNAAVWKEVNSDNTVTMVAGVAAPVASSGQTSFILATPPQNPASVVVQINGICYYQPADISVSGTSVTWQNSFPLATTDIVRFLYF